MRVAGVFSANAENCCQTVTGFLLFCSRLFARPVLHWNLVKIDRLRQGRERQIGMEKARRIEREKQWNNHVREEIRAGGRRRIIRLLTGVTWALLLAAAGVGAYWSWFLEGQVARLRRDQEKAVVQAAQAQVRQDALEAQAAQLTLDNDGLRARLEETQASEEKARAAEAEALAALEEFRTQQPPVAGPSYTSLYPELYAAPAQRETVAPDYTVYLTFDDGPSARTAEVLDILKENGIKATFFVTGQTSELAQEMMRRIVNEGHTIAIHTYSHRYTEIYASVEAYLADFERIYTWVHQVTGVYPQIFRFPGGSINAYNKGIYRELVAEMDRRGFVHYDWNAMCGDADGKVHTPEELAQNSLAMVGSKQVIVLMHDNAVRQTTVACLPAVIAGYRGAGYTFASLTPEVKAITFD